MPRFVVVSGLPASGKSTLARALAGALARPLLDKDDILESLLDSLGDGSEMQRSQLSRAADRVLQTMAAHCPGAVLTSWWKHARSDMASGTPTGWLAALPSGAVEVHCICPPDMAVARFMGRRRHPGHRDDARETQRLRDEFARQFALGSLGIGPTIHVRTDRPIDLARLVAELTPLLAHA